MQTVTKFMFELKPEMAEEFAKEAKRLGIPRVELFRRMFDLWKKQRRE